MSRSPERMNIDEEFRIRGRGASNNDLRRSGRDAMDEDSEPVRSIEGWIIIVRGLHEETDEESLAEKFLEYGTIKNIHLNLDRRTGYVKGYAFIEYEARKEAEEAITDANGTQFMGETIKVDYAFVKGPTVVGDRDRRDRSRRDRSLSPGRN
ncbi:MAG: RNA-binding domain-containing protein [Benjaminiella poitrasii]|nr:MAG: RNA-binding domain-containing protein [Benjaminiella poitrasii]